MAGIPEFNPYSAGISALGSAAGAALGGGQEPQPHAMTHIINPWQQALMHQMQTRALQGNLGEMGFGQAVKQGKSTMQNMMAQSGIRPDSGVYQSALGSMLANATSQDAANRQNLMMQIAGMSPAVVNSSDQWKQVSDTWGDSSIWNPGYGQAPPGAARQTPVWGAGGGSRSMMG